jgi:hypothetical protein
MRRREFISRGQAYGVSSPTSASSPATPTTGTRPNAHPRLFRIAILTARTTAEASEGVGAAVGGTAGLLAGIGLMAVPGVGPVVAAGWLVSTLAGAVAGGATGGIIGALTQAEISKEEADVYAEGLRRDGAVVSARVADGDASRLQALMDRSCVRLQPGRGLPSRRLEVVRPDGNALHGGPSSQGARDIPVARLRLELFQKRRPLGGLSYAWHFQGSKVSRG